VRGVFNELQLTDLRRRPSGDRLGRSSEASSSARRHLGIGRFLLARSG
jgi:hypothetical protein